MAACMDSHQGHEVGRGRTSETLLCCCHTVSKHRTPQEQFNRIMCAGQVGSEICVFKTHVDIFSSWDAAMGAELRRLADKHGAHRSL